MTSTAISTRAYRKRLALVAGGKRRSKTLPWFDVRPAFYGNWGSLGAVLLIGYIGSLVVGKGSGRSFTRFVRRVGSEHAAGWLRGRKLANWPRGYLSSFCGFRLWMRKQAEPLFFHRQGHIRRGLNGEADIDLTLTRNAGTRIHLDCEQQKPPISKLRVAKQ